MSAAIPAPFSGVSLLPTGSLIERALTSLAVEPLSTTALAERVMALRGNPHAASAAVFALLGTDPRFEVDRNGVWSLARPASGSCRETLLRDEEWVVVDVETTGGSPARGHRVIEFAAVHVVGGRIAGEFSSLVNPGRSIPRIITSLTGIDNGAVANAPLFEDLAPGIAESLTGRVFVGHNATFDWRFVCAEMERCSGRTLSGRKFCTLRVARRLLPHLPSRSLGALADYFGIEMMVHHRALDDAIATARLLLGFLHSLEERGITDWAGLEGFYRPRPRRPRRRSAAPRSADRE